MSEGKELARVESMEQLAASAKGDAIALPGRGSNLIINSDMWRFATGLCESGMVPKGLAPKPGAVCAIIQAGAEIGIPPMHALSALTFVNGRLGIMGQDSRGLVRARGAVKQGTNIELTVEGDQPTKLSDWPNETKGVAWAHPAGSSKPVRYEFTVGQARRGGLWGKAGPWSDYPDRMLMNRAWGFLFRDHFSELFSGLWVADELEDIPARDPVTGAKDVTPAHAGPGPGQRDPALALATGEDSDLGAPGDGAGEGGEDARDPLPQQPDADSEDEQEPETLDVGPAADASDAEQKPLFVEE